MDVILALLITGAIVLAIFIGAGYLGIKLADKFIEKRASLRKMRAEMLKVRAKVVHKNTTRLDAAYPGANVVNDSSGEVRGDCFVTFEFDGKVTEFSVSTSLYNMVETGFEGDLVYQGDQVIHFMRTA